MLLGLTCFYLASVSFTGFYLVLQGYSLILGSLSGFYLVLLGYGCSPIFIEFHLVGNDFLEINFVSLDFTVFFTGFYLVPLRFNRFDELVPSFTGL